MTEKNDWLMEILDKLWKSDYTLSIDDANEAHNAILDHLITEMREGIDDPNLYKNMMEYYECCGRNTLRKNLITRWEYLRDNNLKS